MRLSLGSLLLAITLAACLTNEAPTRDDGPEGQCRAGEQGECQSIFPGVCAEGIRQCTAQGSWGPCRAKISPGLIEEECDNHLDDDCDGMTDAQDLKCIALISINPDGENTGPNCEPGVSEESGDLCANGIDDDCDDATDWQDAGCAACASGQQRSCDTPNHGVCRDGTQACGASGQWSDCSPAITPGAQVEDCANGQDDDCDSKIDRDDPDCNPCTPGDAQECPTIFLGACASGSQSCTAAGQWGPCNPAVAPGDLVEDATSGGCANGLDDDCDGLADAEDPGCFECVPFSTDAACATGLSGICASGTRSCSAQGAWGACAPRQAQPESCANGLDDDCDGLTDAADDDSGCCSPGAQGPACASGHPGLCGPGHNLCTAQNVMSSVCTPDVAPGELSESQHCSDGVDNDCDGLTDAADQEDCAICVSGEKRPCVLGGLAGRCAQGQETCSGGQWGGCLQVHAPQAEDCCADEDLNCNGLTGGADPVCNQCTPGAACATSVVTPGCSTGTRLCVTNAQCVLVEGDCTPPDGSELVSQCNGLDDDCDGLIDEGTQISGEVRVMEYLTPGACQLLLADEYPGYGHECIFFMNWSAGGMGRYMVADITDSWRAISSGDAYAFFEARAPALFSSAAQVQWISSLVLLPAGSFNGAITADSLALFSSTQESTSQRLRILNLTDKSVGTSTIAALGVPGVTDTITASAYVKASDVPSINEDLILITRGSSIYFYANSTGWVPGDDIQTFLGASPAGFSLNTQVSGLTLYRTPGVVLMGATSTNGHFGYMDFSNYGAWLSSPATFSCAR